MTRDERDEIRRRIDAARRRRIQTVCDLGYDNPETGYRNGCRCDRCRLGTMDAVRARKRRRLARGAAA